MLYLERKPAAPLDRFVRALWYTRTDMPAPGRERVLPTGCIEVIIALARDFLVECRDGGPAVHTAPALVVGARSVYEIIDRSDLADLIGVVFLPGGFAPFIPDAVDRLSNRILPLEDIWGHAPGNLRDRLRELPSPEARLLLLESFLSKRLVPRLLSRPACTDEVGFALRAFGRAPGVSTVREVALRTGLSERRFSQVFRERVGLSPKAWCRVQRFQRAVRHLYAGGDVRWAEMALACGYYDQSHFANEFRAFSGIDATTYSAQPPGPWANHVPAD